MQKFLTTFLFCFILAQTFGQTQRKVSTYLQGQFNKTIYDRTIGNNPWGIGLGVQTFLNASSKLKPTIDLTADAYLQDDKVLRLNPDDTPIDDIGGMVNLFAGASYHPSNKVYISFVTGPSFISGQTMPGISPHSGFTFRRRKSGREKFLISTSSTVIRELIKILAP